MRVAKLAGVAVAAVTMVAMTAPADAQRWGGGRHHPHRGGVDGGDVLLGAVLAGGIFAILSSASKDREPREVEEVYVPPLREPVPPPAWLPNSQQPDAAYDTGDGDGEYGYDAPGSGGGVGVDDADSAADMCAGAALSEGQRYARVASIGAIDAVDPLNGGWSVRGSILLRDDYRKRGNERSFTCSIAAGGAPSVRIEGYGQ